MATALDLPPIGTGLLANVESSALRFGLSRDHFTEAAARAAAALARRQLESDVSQAIVVGLIGTGVKGCIALHALRILHGFGAECSAVMAGGTQEMRPETARAAETLDRLRRRMLQPRSPIVRNALADADLIIDGLVGVGLDGPPREPHATLIRLCNEVRGDVLSLETPSGLHPDTGEPLAPTIKARATLALGLPARGNFSALAWQFTGELWLCDIGYPPQALEEHDLDADGLFTQGELIRIR